MSDEEILKNSNLPSQIKKYSKVINGVIVTPIFKCSGVEIDEETGELIYKDLLITKSAEEAYQDSLKAQEGNKFNNLSEVESAIVDTTKVLSAMQEEQYAQMAELTILISTMLGGASNV